ncbi:hypothetical protein BMF94_2217 [Rhodotorula taiwanensis]|uniref:Uncharacterized protein n=1 Tax=Rhodotorula taiwanensis TaxID=741276 RepID=A0A2S5BDC1_9BASI|nr:hypothetical protein BMF94_2217 [Rhodotorula taiwanensis]
MIPSQQTRRSTRRSLGTGQGVENDVANRVPAAAGRVGNALASGSAAIKPAPSKVVAGTSAQTRRPLGVPKPIVMTDKPAASNAAAGVRGKRSAFADVTNGAKAKAGPSTLGVKPALRTAISSTSANAVASSSNIPTRPKYRTRSSTGGAIKEEDEGLGFADGVKVEQRSDAMAIDDEATTSRATGRQVKSLRKGAAGPSKVVASTSAAPARRPLAAKRDSVNGAVGLGAVGAGKAGQSKPTPAAVRVARRRVEEAEQRHRAAVEELEAAKRFEADELKRAALDDLDEEAGRRIKRQKTSEPEQYQPDFDDEEEADDDVEGPRMSKWETEVEGRAKDEGWEDLDEGDEDDPLMVSTYVVEVYEYLRELELTTMPDPDYMSKQNEVTWKMRGILVDWLVEIHTKFRLLPETIFLAVNIIDRFLSVRVVSIVKFQLVGVTALFIAAKYEEVVCPSVQNFLYMTDGGYTDEEILKAERYILGIIEFNLSYPNPINFLRRVSKADGYDIHSRTMAKYLMEISIVDHKFMSTPPSLIAAAATWLARRVLNSGPWDANLVHYSGYAEDELKPTAQLMLDYIVRTSPSLSKWAAAADEDGEIENPLEQSPEDHEFEHPNFIKKYGAKKFFKASTSTRKWAESEYAPVETYDETGMYLKAQPIKL